MAYYRTCPRCGCNLDPGEKCDCQEKKEKEKKRMESMLKIEQSGQLSFSWRRNQ